jgi:branched-chain amino acid transport system substrate-binding protein
MSQGLSSRRGVTRRGFLTVAVSAIVAGVVAGVGAYYAGTFAAPVRVVTETVTSTTTLAAGAPQTVTVTAPASTVTTTVTTTRVVTTTPPPPTAIKLGALVDLEGIHASGGVRNKITLEMFAEKINQDGGVYVKEYGRTLPVEIYFLNTKGDPALFTSYAKKLVEEYKVVGLLCSHPAALSIPVASVAETYKVPGFAAGPGEVFIAAAKELPTGRWTYAWNIFFSAKEEYELFVMMINKHKEELGEVVVGIVMPDDPDGRVLASSQANIYRAAGFKVLDPILYPLGTTDFSGALMRLKEAGVNVLSPPIHRDHFITFWRQAHALGWKPKMVLGSLYIETLTDVKLIGDTALGLMTLLGWSPDFPFPWNDWIKETWPKKTDLELMQTTAFQATQLLVLLDAIQRAGTLDPKAINEAMGRTDMMTPLGRVKFDENHCAVTPSALFQAQKVDGEWALPCVMVHPRYAELGIRTVPEIFPIP